jgi:hypothetical protein
VDYNEFIIARQGKIVGQILSVADTMVKDARTAESMLREGVLIADSALADLERLGSFKGDTAFRNAARASFRFYRRLFASEYPKVIRIRHGHDSGEQHTYMALNSIRLALEKEEAELDKRLGNAQAGFAKRNNMPLLQNGVQGKMD